MARANRFKRDSLSDLLRVAFHVSGNSTADDRVAYRPTLPVFALDVPWLASRANGRLATFGAARIDGTEAGNGLASTAYSGSVQSERTIAYRP